MRMIISNFYKEMRRTIDVKKEIDQLHEAIKKYMEINRPYADATTIYWSSLDLLLDTYPPCE